MVNGNPWSKEEIRFLRLNAALMPPDQLAAKLGRTTIAITSMAKRRRITMLRPGERPDALALERHARIVSRPGLGLDR